MATSEEIIDDLEAVAPLPRESEALPAIEEEQPPRSVFSRRRKTVLAVVSVLLVVAISVAVGLSANNPSESTSAEQGAAMQNDQDTVVVADEPSDESSAGPPEEQEELDDEDEEEASLDTTIDLDVDHDADHPEDVINDVGYEQEPEFLDIDGTVHETTEEKVPFNSEDFAIEISDFEGPITDFIVPTELARISFTTSAGCKPNEGLWRLDATMDDYPWESLWELRDNQGNTLAKGPPEGRNYARRTRYVGQLCLPQGRYTMVFGDKNNDGICCEYGPGTMAVKVNGNLVAQTPGEGSDNTNFSKLQIPFRVNPSQPTPKPPTPKPTPKPNPKPSPKPTPATEGPCANTKVEVVVRTDKWGRETGYKFERLPAGANSVLIEKEKGDLEPETTYRDTFCVQDGRYRLTVTDPITGIQSPGFYAVNVDGQEVVQGSRFAGGSISHIIRVGFEPPITSQGQVWLDGHNTRREEFHESEGKTYKPLVWSASLAKDASDWVDVIMDNNCKISREKGLVVGENMSARVASSGRDEGPETIMNRWIDNKINSGYPSNQSATQALWRASRYMGCSYKEMTRENGSVCYVSICRYARAGNCGMGRYDTWKDAVLADRTPCGPPCVNEGCY